MRMPMTSGSTSSQEAPVPSCVHRMEQGRAYHRQQHADAVQEVQCGKVE